MNALSISLSGIRAAQTSLSASAAGIARMATTDGASLPVRPDAVPPPGDGPFAASDPAPAGDIVRDVVGLLQAKNALLANLAVFRAADATAAAALDLYG